MENDKIIIYQTEDGQTQIDVRLENETVWLTQAQMAELFQTTKQNVSLHLNNLYKEGELKKEGTVKEYLTVQQEGKRKVSRIVKYYDLDVIISVGYRVKSKRGTAFRIWARKIIKDYLVKGYAVNERIRKEQIGELRQLVGTSCRSALRIKMLASIRIQSLAAITSISTKAPFGSVLTATAERAGYGSVKNSAYTSFIAAKSFISAINTVVLMTLLMLRPASLKIAWTLFSD